MGKLTHNPRIEDPQVLLPPNCRLSPVPLELAVVRSTISVSGPCIQFPATATVGHIFNNRETIFIELEEAEIPLRRQYLAQNASNSCGVILEDNTKNGSPS